MMLNFDQRSSRFLRHQSGVVFRVKVTGNDLWLRFQQCLQPADSLLQCIHSPEIRQISHIGGRIEQIVDSHTEGVFQLASRCKDPPLKPMGQNIRKRSVSPGPPYHIRLSPVKIHHRIIGSDPDFAVMGQHRITEAGELFSDILVLPADGSSGDVSAGHHQAVRHFDAVIVIEQQDLHRSIWKHDSHFGIVRCNRRTELSALLLIQQKNRFLMPAQDLFLFRCNHAFPFHNGMIPHHHCERFHRSCFQGTEPGYRGFIGGIACQMEPSNPLHRHNAAFRDDAAGVSDGLSAPFVPIHDIYFRSAIVAAYRLRIVSPGLGIIVFLRTFRTHGKFLHTGPFPVIGKRIQDRQPRAAAGAVDERVLIPPVLRIIHLLDAFIADGDIRRHKDLTLGLFALNNLES